MSIDGNSTAGVNYYQCTVMKVAAGNDGGRQVALTGGPFVDPGGTFYGIPTGVAGDSMFAVALVACTTQQLCAAFVDSTTSYHTLSQLHIAGAGSF